MDRVAAEVAQEVRVLLQHDDIDAGTGQKVAGHHPGGATSVITTRQVNRASVATEGIRRTSAPAHAKLVRGTAPASG